MMAAPSTTSVGTVPPSSCHWERQSRTRCQAALEMKRELDGLNRELQGEGIPRLNIGIGLNTGPMAVGNMGSARRFDYTVLGDAVNLASRLEGLNKEYGTNIVVAATASAPGGKSSSTASARLYSPSGTVLEASGVVMTGHFAAACAGHAHAIP